MCGRFTLTTDPGIIARRFGAPPAEGGGTTPRYNVAPTQTVVTVTDDGQRHLAAMRWGLVPRWAKDPAIGSKMINARAETLAEKPAFRQVLQKRRCLIPADGFYEWPNRGKSKQPLRVTLTTGEPFAFAGLWDTWHAPDGQDLRTCTIVTTTPNALMAPFHHRMPVILTPEAEQVWLDPTIDNPEQLVPLLVPYPAEAMHVYPVSTLVNRVANDSPQLVLPLESAAEPTVAS
jgi:putative SOS response-associated peptidase YedK